jgi:hypothetical protein
MTFHNGIDIPTTFDLEPGAQTVSSQMIETSGEATLLGVRSNDIPLVKVKMSKGSASVVMAAAGYSIDFQSERAYNFSGKAGLVNEKHVNKTRRAIDEKLHYFAAYGDQNLGVTGLLNKTGVTATTSTFDVNSASYANAIDFCMALVTDLSLDTRGVFGTSLTVLCGAKTFHKLARITDPQNADRSVLQAVYSRLQAMGRGYESVRFEPRWELDSAMLENTRFGVMSSGTNRDRWVVYAKSPEVCSRQMEASIAQLFPREYVRTDENGAIVYPMFSVASETQISTLNAIKYIDAPRAV